MSRNGQGIYNLPAGNPVITGTVIASTWANSTFTDVAAALTGSVAADGQTPMVGDLDMNTNKIINLDPATVAGDAVEYAQFVAATTTNVNITGGAINGTPIGNTTRSSGKFTTLDANSTLNVTGATTLASTLGVTGATTLSSTLAVTGVATFAADSQFNGTGALKLPVGTTGQRPSPVAGMVRYNNTIGQFEGYGTAWAAIGGSTPQVTAYTSGSGTYTVPAGTKFLQIRMVGAGGGGGAISSAGSAGGNTTFGTALLVANGGGAGQSAAGGAAVGGSASGGDINISGGSGGAGPQQVPYSYACGAAGGNSAFGGGAGQSQAATAGTSGATNSGGGGSGGAAGGTASSAGGGGAGGYVEKLISSPNSTYAYVVGAGGAGGSSGTAGGDGGSGVIIITAYLG